MILVRRFQIKFGMTTEDEACGMTFFFCVFCVRFFVEPPLFKDHAMQSRGSVK